MRVLSNKSGKLLWPKLFFGKWLRFRRKGDEFHADQEEDSESEVDDEEKADFDLERRHSCSTTREHVLRRSSSSGFGLQPPRHSSATLAPRDSEILKAKFTDKHQFRIFVGTWNVGGRTPHDQMDLEEWLGSKEPADIYVIGFQEVVPLNAGNVLVSTGNLSAVRWLHLIRHTLNNTTCNSLRRSCSSPASPWQGETDFNETMDNVDGHLAMPGKKDRSFMFDDFHQLENGYSRPEETLHGRSLERTESRNTINSTFLDDDSALKTDEEPPPSPILSPILRSRSLAYRSEQNRSRYALVASKKMVGILLTVWVRADLRRHIRNLKVSCVGCGLMGYLGNKGSISISMCLYQTSFCFICSHLTSGEKEGDELRRNSDVTEILRRTQFSRSGDFAGMGLPETILEHDRIIWLGDLNYRLALSSGAMWSLLMKGDWEALLAKDQLHIEQRAGRVFEGWHEGKIYFAPTYKYRANSDHYAVGKLKLGEKRRTPAWCDRILWFGKGLKQLAYVRAESKFSDHRPVYAVFSVEVDVLSRRKVKEILAFTNAKVEIEELLPCSESKRRMGI